MGNARPRIRTPTNVELICKHNAFKSVTCINRLREVSGAGRAFEHFSRLSPSHQRGRGIPPASRRGVLFVGFKFFLIQTMIQMWTGSREPHKEEILCMIS